MHSSSGLDEDSQPAAIRSAIESGHFQVNDPIILGIWTSSDPMPPPHWADGVSELSDAELQFLIDIVANAAPRNEPDEAHSRLDMCRYTDGELLAMMADGYCDTVRAIVAAMSGPN